MSESSLQTFSNGVASYLTSCVFPAIVQGLSNRNVMVSVEDLLQMTNTPSVRQPQIAQPAQITQSAIPSIAFGGAVPIMATANVTSPNRKVTATNAPVAGRTCMYQFKRGEHKNKYCGKATAPGSDYCTACLKSRKNIQKELASSGTLPGAAPSMGTIPGMGGIPPSYSSAGDNGGDSQGNHLSVTVYDESRGLFRELNHQFIVYQVSPGVIAVLGRLSDDDNTIVPLSLQEQATAQSMGLALGEHTANSSPQQAVPSIPSHPLIPSVPSVPSVPIMTSTTLPVITPLVNYAPSNSDHMAGIPQIPQIPQILAK